MKQFRLVRLQRSPTHSPRFFQCAVLLVVCAAPAVAFAAEPLSYNRDIRPLLADKCFACHGPDEGDRQADLRLDIRASALKTKAIVPRDPDHSKLVRRIFSTDSDERMPPDETGRTLTDRQKQVLRRWIAEGAAYEQHWAFVPPRRPPLPRVSDSDWPRNEIDRFVLARLEARNLRPAEAADRYTLARRVYLDLIGLPPSPAEADAFVRDTSPDAYERLVERLLASPRYGEHWARRWLDLARYADTNGYEKDRPRSIWPYRDWVIRALNDDMPFDQFSIEQLAGDMLPDATVEQRVATGFHRNTMLNEEGGIDPLEFRFYAMVDRVATTGTVWLGLTVGCAQCHTHKYDPISHTDYYRLMALLNNADEPDLTVPSPSVAARRAELLAKIDRLEAELPQHFPPAPGEGPVAARRRQALEEAFTKWTAQQRRLAGNWRTLRPKTLESNLPRLTVLDDGSILSQGDITKRDVFKLTFSLTDVAGPITALRLEALPDERLPAGGPGRAFYEGRKGDFFLSEVTVRVAGRQRPFSAASHSYGKISIGSGTAEAGNVIDGKPSTGWSTSGREGQASQLALQFDKPLAADGELEIEMLFERHFAASLGRFRFAATSDSPPAAASKTPVAVTGVLARPRYVDRRRQGVAQDVLLERRAGVGRRPAANRRASQEPAGVSHDDGARRAAGG